MRLAMILSLMSASVLASYRVYELEITHFDLSLKKVGTEKVLSTMDHLQYEHYHTGYRRDHVRLVDTWYCPGDTSGKKYCPKPKVKDSWAYDPRDKRTSLPYNRQPVIP